MSNGTGRTRNFATVVYPDSLCYRSDSDNFLGCSDFRQLLSDLKINALVSPLHCNDKNATGDIKKEHYHIILTYDSVKTLKQAKEDCEKFGGVGCEKVQSLRNYARYLCHLDNPDKAQYKVDDVQIMGDIDYISLIQSASSKYNEIGAMMDFCRSNQIYQFYELLDYARDYMPDSWFRLLCDNSAYIMKEYLKSLYWDSKSED